ncbi:CHAT domain-containing protein [Nocardia jiangsuensis]|uniref:CHAT domain-containing protein n=1 Tax=Nocardia jiangsuensis TaxID=1691563 RepID=A0ABV8DVP1_9NOCA
MTPTAHIRMADAGDLYLWWRWENHTAAPGIGVVPEAQLRAVLDELTAALPDPATPGSLENALTAGALADPDREQHLAEQLARAFLPYNLAVALHELMTSGIRPHLRIQPAPRVAQVPWELLAPDPAIRLIEIADLSLLPPVSVVRAREPRPWNPALPVVAVLDPRVPGFRADSALGSVLGRPDPATPVARRVAEYAATGRLAPAAATPADAFRRTDLDRDLLGELLRAGASRLLYVGHVTAAAPESGRSEEAALHLACPAELPGFAAPLRTHRPFTAKDLLLGSHTRDPDPQPGTRLWPIPARVALIACESGGDLRFGEALGLVTAMIAGGAELVTACRWPLPTDLAVQRLAGAPATATPLQDTICAIDTAHEHPDPVAAHADWQRTRLTAWRTTPSPATAPVLWAAPATVYST